MQPSTRTDETRTISLLLEEKVSPKATDETI